MSFGLIAVSIVSLAAVLVGGQAATWRRACVLITKAVHLTPLARDLSQEQISRFTPKFVAMRHRFALILLFSATLLGLVVLGWKMAIGVFLGTYTLMEISGFLYPKPADPYYLKQVTSEFEKYRDLYRRFNDEKAAADMQERLELLLPVADRLEAMNRAKR